MTSLGTVLLPRVSYYLEHGKMEEFRRITKKALNFVFLFAAPMMLYFILYAREGIYLFSGTAYTESIIPMQIIMPTLLLIGITNVLGIQILVPMGREKSVLYSEIAGAVVDVAINAILIPRYTSVGAAIGTLIAESVVFIIQYMALRDEVWESFRSVHYIKLLSALALGSVVSLWVKALGLGNFVALFISAILFCGIYGGFLLITKEELVVEIFYQIIGKRFSEK